MNILAYKIVVAHTARKQILSVPKEAQLTIVVAVDPLMSCPRPLGCKKLRGTGLWRLRVGRYRVVYALDDKSHLITILKVAIRSEDTYGGF